MVVILGFSPTFYVRTTASTVRVDFVVSGGEVVSTTVDIVQRNRVLNMLLQHALNDPTKPIVLKDDRNTIEALLSHLAGEKVDLANRGLTCLITLFRCAHQYQCYSLGSQILRELERYHSPENVLNIYTVVQPLPELPEIDDPSAPSAPPETDLRDVDPEQAGFAALLKRTFQRCIEVIDNRSGEVLSSDALLSLSLCQLQELAQRDSLRTRELDIGRGLLRWLRYHSVTSHLSTEQRRHLMLGSLRLLTMSAKELKKLELEREGVLTREELEAVLRYTHHDGAQLPAQLEPYVEYWRWPRAGGKGSRGVLQRLKERTRGGGYGGQDVVDSAERREATMQKRSRRVDKVKMALATGASFIFD